MTLARSDVALELHSLVTPESTLELSLAEVPIAGPEPNEVLIRVEVAPINPLDLGLLFAGVDVSTATVAGAPDNPVVTAPLSPGATKALAARGRSVATRRERRRRHRRRGRILSNSASVTGEDRLPGGRRHVRAVPMC
jgi:hypothetical protein